MSKTISYRGTLPVGEQDIIRLRTNNGKTGYKITKFQLMSTTPGQNAAEYIGQIFNKDQTGSITDNVNFSDSNLLAVVFMNVDTRVDGSKYTHKQWCKRYKFKFAERIIPKSWTDVKKKSD